MSDFLKDAQKLTKIASDAKNGTINSNTQTAASSVSQVLASKQVNYSDEILKSKLVCEQQGPIRRLSN